MANLENNAPEWNATGAEPSTELKSEGFKAGYKPPAAYFNWFFNKIYLAVKEIQTLIKNDTWALKSHESTDTTYGAGNANNYGHVKLQDTADSTKKAANGTAATPAAVASMGATRSTATNLVNGTGTKSIKQSNATAASGNHSAALGSGTTANGVAAYAEGYNTKAEDYSHAEGYHTTAGGADRGEKWSGAINYNQYAHAEGLGSSANGSASHAEGLNTYASGQYSHAEGSNTTASNNASHAEGENTTASGIYSHAEGNYTKAIAPYSHAEGGNTTASGNYSHAEGYYTTASGAGSHAGGTNTIAVGNQRAIGHYNKEGTEASASGTDGDAFIIGNGTSTTRSNAFRFTYAGQAYGLAAWSTIGADYAEFFEWLDGNPDNEDRRGYFVTLENGKIRKAEASDDVLGIVSGNASVIGNADIDWCGMYVRDDFGTPLKDDKGNMIVNPDYDDTQEYIQRADRKEWSTVGLLGVVVARDNGKCKANGYCINGNGGIAEPSDAGYKVINRINDDLVRVLVR